MDLRHRLVDIVGIHHNSLENRYKASLVGVVIRKCFSSFQSPTFVDMFRVDYAVDMPPHTFHRTLSHVWPSGNILRDHIFDKWNRYRNHANTLAFPCYIRFCLVWPAAMDNGLVVHRTTICMYIRQRLGTVSFHLQTCIVPYNMVLPMVNNRNPVVDDMAVHNTTQKKQKKNGFEYF